MISIGKNSEGRNVAIDLDVLLRTRMLVQANSGGGKSWLLRRLAEQFFSRVQTIIIDPEGEFATLREKYGFVLVGKGGETPADVRSAGLVAQKLLELRASAVCDIYEMKPSERHPWVRTFLDAMIDAPKKLWHPVVFIVDEAHMFCPEKGAGESEASDSIISLATRGRKRGFCPIFATQRVSKLRKDALETQNVLVGATFWDLDRARAAETLGISKAEKEEFFQTVKLLEPGKFFGLGRAISMERILIQVGPVETTHPESGSSKHAAEPPPTPDKIKDLLPKLADLPKAAEEKARTEAELRNEIRSLRAQLRQQPTAPAPIADEKAIARAIEKNNREWQSKLEQYLRQGTKMRNELADISSRAAKAAGIELPKIEVPKVVQHSSPARSVTPGVTQPENGNGKLRAGAERMLASLCQWSPEGMREGQMRAHAGMKKSGTFSTYLSDLRTGGYIREDGGLLFASDNGLDYFGGNIPQAPQSTDEVLAVWEPKLREGARRMLRVLVEAREWLPLSELADKAGFAKSGTFSTYLSDLRTARLIETERGNARANPETLFL